MPLPTVTNGYYWQLRGTLGLTQFAEVTGALTQTGTTAIDVAGEVLTAWNDNYIPKLSDDWKNLGCTVTKLDGVSAGVEEPDTTVGGFSGSSVPYNCAMVISWKTGLAGRSRRGRMYLPGLPQDAVGSDRSQWLNTNVSQFESATEDFLGSLTTATAVPGVLSRTLGAITPITTFVVRQTIATQRRRLTGGLA